MIMHRKLTMVYRINDLLRKIGIHPDRFKPEEYQITLTDINTCINACGYSSGPFPSKILIESLNKLNNKNEAAMFLAHIFHESEGLKYREEIDKSNTYMTDIGIPGKSYHGRGYMMLSWPENYLKCSEALGMGNELLHEPEKVSSDVLAVESAFWYWKEVVVNAKGVGDDCFWSSTMAINGALESTNAGRQMAKHRYENYVKIARALKLKDYAKK